jgi:hypothetical protein
VKKAFSRGALRLSIMDGKDLDMWILII